MYSSVCPPLGSQVEMLQSVDGAQSIDTSNLATPAALEVPGKKNGEVLVVAVPGRGAIAYSWNQEEHQVQDQIIALAAESPCCLRAPTNSIHSFTNPYVLLSFSARPRAVD